MTHGCSPTGSAPPSRRADRRDEPGSHPGRCGPRRQAARSRTARTGPRPDRAGQDRLRRCPPRARHVPARTDPAWSARSRRAARQPTPHRRTARCRGAGQPPSRPCRGVARPRPRPATSPGRSASPARSAASHACARSMSAWNSPRSPTSSSATRSRSTRAPSRSPSRIFPLARSASAQRSVAPRPRPRELRTRAMSEARACEGVPTDRSRRASASIVQSRIAGTRFSLVFAAMARAASIRPSSPSASSSAKCTRDSPGRRRSAESTSWRLARLGDERQRVLPTTADRKGERSPAQQVEAGGVARHRAHGVRPLDRELHLAAHGQQEHRVRLDSLPLDGIGEAVERAHQQVDRVFDSSRSAG